MQLFFGYQNAPPYLAETLIAFGLILAKQATHTASFRIVTLCEFDAESAFAHTEKYFL